MHDYRNVIVSKPWGHEYLVYENEQVALWFLHINAGQSTSMHCHPTKTTGLVLLEGSAELSFLADKKLIHAPEKQMIRRGLFHSTKAMTPDGCRLFEIETPNDKEDIVRLSDRYGRESAGYENSQHEMNRTDQCLWIEDPSRNQIVKQNIENLFFSVERTDSLDFLEGRNPNDIVIFLKGGLGRMVDGKKRLATVPGDVGKVEIVKQVAKEMEFVESETIILTVES
jgi:mannose-6-phosphate isomerase-like protein (cupin superfamily)